MIETLGPVEHENEHQYEYEYDREYDREYEYDRQYESGLGSNARVGYPIFFVEIACHDFDLSLTLGWQDS